ncbi:DUF397 domain-containing protein [Streptomyces sp. NBC_00028]|uniref:DUF397 domain-containing protein n=1 Tax=Streptomyces sp. NBC_00028 TaxID=2975624 RepID=UPI003244C608
MTSALEWFKSSYSSNDGPECVEVAISPADPNTTVHVRDSKDTHRPHITVTDHAWSTFISAYSA